MALGNSIRSILLVIMATIILSACATKTTKKAGDYEISKISGDTYTGQETVKYLATGVPDRVFFATNKSVLTTASRDTLRKQAAWLRENKSINVTVEGIQVKVSLEEMNIQSSNGMTEPFDLEPFSR